MTTGPDESTAADRFMRSDKTLAAIEEIMSAHRERQGLRARLFALVRATYIAGHEYGMAMSARQIEDEVVRQLAARDPAATWPKRKVD